MKKMSDLRMRVLSRLGLCPRCFRRLKKVFEGMKAFTLITIKVCPDDHYMRAVEFFGHGWLWSHTADPETIVKWREAIAKMEAPCST